MTNKKLCDWIDEVFSQLERTLFKDEKSTGQE